MLGHSIGEYAAAHAAGVISLEDGLRLIAARGRLMQALPQGGGMVAVMASPTQIASLPDGVEIAAINGPENTVISGELPALNKVVDQLKSQGLQTKQLRVFHAFHSAQMEPMLAEFAQVARTIAYHPPTVEIISSVTGAMVNSEITNPEYWIAQIRQPVQFSAAMETLTANSGDNPVLIEIGPRPTLIAMGRACMPTLLADWLPSLSPQRSRQANAATSIHPDWETLLSSVGKLYEIGKTIDWAGFDRSYPRQTVLLPNYPFQRKRYWLEPEANSHQENHFVAASEQHPLLGRVVGETLPARPVTGDRTRYFEAQLQPDSPLNWSDHQVFKTALMPAAAYLEMGIAAGKETFEGSYCLENVRLQQGLWLNEASADSLPSLRLRTAVTRQTTERYEFEISSLSTASSNAGTSANNWTRHVAGVVSATSGEKTVKILDLAEIRQRLAECCSQSQLYRQFSQSGIDYGLSFQGIKQVWFKSSTAALAQVELPASESDSFLIHPVLLDAGLQLAGVTLLEATGSYLPVAIAKFTQYQSLPSTGLWVYAQLCPDFVGDRPNRKIATADISWLSAQGQVLAQMEGLRLQAVDAPGSEQIQWLHEVMWRSQPLPPAPADFLRRPEAVQACLSEPFTQLTRQPDFLTYQSLQPDLNALALAYIQQAFLQMGWSRKLGETLVATYLAHLLQVVPQQRKLFSHCLALLTANEIETPLDPQQIYQQLSQHPQLGPETTLLSRCGGSLADVLQGRHLDPLTLLFPGGDLTDLTQLYQRSIGSQVMNQLMQKALTATAAQSPADRPLRILEIGAGTGGTTAYLLPSLAALSHPVTYCFTDISGRFISAAQKRFQAFSFVDYALLNIENAPEAQGFATDFDIVIAANVLHATADLQKTLTNVSALLIPGGQLILLEGTRPVNWVDLIFGLTPGWWRFTDTALRPHHPLISVTQWQTLLKSVGFEAATALQAEANKAATLSQSVIIAQRQKVVQKHWGLLGEADGASLVGSLLQEKDQHFEILSQAEDFQGDGVIYALPPGNVTDTVVVEATESICRQALETIQTLIRQPHPPRLYFVSTNTSPAAQLIHAGLWGLLQTAQLEHPELRCTCIQAETPEQIVTELLASPETQIAYRDGQRQVARIEDYQAAVPTQLVADPAGTLTGLRWQPAPRRQPGAHEVEIRIHASGLNFRDVLIAMGQYPEAAPLGCECVGEVVAVGSAVTALQMGQSVMAIASHSFAQYATVHADLVAPIPAATTAAEAATLPVAFVTAYYSLSQLAQLQPGERVLIHAATGGVGQAAVQVAQQIGADIFATASPGKWDTLRSLGVTQIMNSRTLAFADEIMVATQGQGVSVVLNALPGEFRAKSLEALGSQGRFVEIGKGDGLTTAEIGQLRPDVQHFSVDIAALCQQQPQQIQTLLRHLSQAVSDGRWRSLPRQTFTQSDTVKAFRTLQQAKHIGKIVVTQDTGLSKHDHQQEDIHLQADSTYLVTGGLGGLGLVMAEWLAAQGAGHIVLLSRHAPTPETQSKLDALEQQGATLTVRSADVTDRAALAGAIAEITENDKYPGSLKGIIHAAGTLDDALIQQMDWPQFQRTLAPKVSGAWNLHTLTQAHKLDFFILFSSAAALLGSPGQANHATANAFLDGLARYRHQAGLPALSINWGAWSTVGSALRYQQQGELSHLSGVNVIDPKQGLAKFEEIWLSNRPQVAIVPINWPSFLTQPSVNNLSFFATAKTVSHHSPTRRLSVAEAPTFLSQLTATPPEEKQSRLDAYICDRLCQTLGFSASELDRQTGFFDLGMDSLTALELKNSLQSDLGLILPSTLAFDYPTVEALLTYLSGQLIEEETTLAKPQPEANADLLGGDLAAQMDRKLADIEHLLGEGT